MELERGTCVRAYRLWCVVVEGLQLSVVRVGKGERMVTLRKMWRLKKRGLTLVSRNGNGDGSNERE